jgi:hypothetical protein
MGQASSHGGLNRSLGNFGGWKALLFGDIHVHGTEGVHFYTRGKAVDAADVLQADPRPAAQLCRQTVEVMYMLRDHRW